MFDSDRTDRNEQLHFGMYEGTVVKRDADLKRIKFTIPGFIEPESPWAYPLGAGGGGSSGVGMLGLPRVGATVAIWFANGNIEAPRYMPAHWTEEEVPAEIQGKEDAAIWSSENFAIVIDDTKGSAVLRIINRKTNDAIELNAEENTITINGTTGITLQALGAIELVSAPGQIILNGRKVLPNSSPI